MRRIKELDGLRGIAILLVLSFHYLNNPLYGNTTYIGKIIYQLTSFGWAGVDLFFVLSGFLIGNILFNNEINFQFIKHFYIRRILRIVPVYFLLIFLFIAVLNSGWFNQNLFLTGHNLTPLWSYFLLVQNLYMASVEYMGNASMSITWSICIEEQFYIIFPLICLLIKRKHLPIFLVILILITPIFRWQISGRISTYVLLHCRMDAIAFGLLIAYYRSAIVDLSKKWKYFFIFILISTITTLLVLYFKFQDLGVLRNTYLSIIFAIGLIFALQKNKGFYHKLLSFDVLAWFGTLSYSLYLFHYIILGLIHHWGGNTEYISIRNGHDIYLTILALAVSLILSLFIYKKIEIPISSFGRKFTYGEPKPEKIN